MTLHDYKLVCPTYAMVLNGKICEKCKEGKYYYCFINHCTKGSMAKSLVNTLEMYLHHNLLHIYNKIDVFISPSKFLMNKTKEMGLKGEIRHLPNFVYIENIKPSYIWENEYIVYVGRLSHEKGLETLINAVKGLNVNLKIIGDGPLKEALLKKTENEGIKNVELLGYKQGFELQNEIRNSMFLVMPSECYENNPRSVIEAFALGKPVIGARIGGIPELVKDGETGLTFEPWNSEDLKDKIEILLNDKDKIISMGKMAREFVEKELNPEKHYQYLMKIYERAVIKYNNR